MRKRVFGNGRAAKAQISLRIRAVWSGPSLSANRIVGYYRMYEWSAKARMTIRLAHYDPNLCNLRMLEGTFSLDAAHIYYTMLNIYSKYYDTFIAYHIIVLNFYHSLD